VDLHKYNKIKIRAQKRLNLAVEYPDPRIKNDDWHILPKTRHYHHVGVFRIFPLAFPNLFF